MDKHSVRVLSMNSYSTYGFVQCIRIPRWNPYEMVVHVLAVDLLLLFTNHEYHGRMKWLTCLYRMDQKVPVDFL